MAEADSEHREALREQHTPDADTVTSEFVSGLEQPVASPNGFGADAEPPLGDNPEVIVGAAFVGGFLLGRLVKRLGT
jgi:hypothetical protein